MNIGVPAIDRFRMKYDIADNGCWIWKGATTGKSGYGAFYAGQRITAHRFAYETFIGPVPEGLDVDHLCRNRLCVNPDHLEPVTRRENVVRGVSPNAANAAKTHCIRGHPLTRENCYASKWPRNRECKECARLASKAKTAKRRAEKNANALRLAIRELGG